MCSCISIFKIPLGISITCGIRVGNALGAGKPTEAKRTAYTSLLLAGTFYLHFAINSVHSGTLFVICTKFCSLQCNSTNDSTSVFEKCNSSTLHERRVSWGFLCVGGRCG